MPGSGPADAFDDASPGRSAGRAAANGTEGKANQQREAVDLVADASAASLRAGPPRRAARDLRPAIQYILPSDLRPDLAQAWGVVVDTPTLGAMLRPPDVILAVGDVVSITLQDLGIAPRLFICDYRTQRGEEPALRKRLGAWGDREIRVDNPPATITRAAWDAVREGLASPGTTRIVVDGEEDMLGIPCFLEAPEGAIVVYGMPGQGAVVCPVTPALQDKVAHIVARMQ